MMSQLPLDADRRGYLLEDWRLFHLKETWAQRFGYHYHDFDKAVFFCSGQVTYTIEGRSYALSPGDVLLVPHHHIHQPDIGGATYERYILWLTPDFLSAWGLDACFQQANRLGFHLIRPGEAAPLREKLEQMEACRREDRFGAALLERTLCLQFLIGLNRCALERPAQALGRVCASDEKIQQVMAYINAHLTDPLTVEDLAAACYLSPSRLMHRFKAAAGCSVHQYVIQKRLIAATDLLRSGMGAMKAAREAGFRDYSSFLRAYRSAYGTSPRAMAEGQGRE